MTPALCGGLIGLGAWVLFRLDEKPGLAPDSRYYLELGEGKRVPEPFCWRWLWPQLFRRLGKRAHGWQAVVCLSLMVQGAAIANLAGTPIAAVLLMGLPGGARFSVRYPLLVDAPTLAIVLVAAAWPPSHPAAASLVLALMRENALIWQAVLTREWWPLAVLPLALGLGWLSSRRRPSEWAGDNLWITHPLRTSLAGRRGMWLSFSLMVLPWGVVLPLALLSPSWELAGILALAYLPLAGVSDTARVYQWAAPSIILIALQAPVPAMAWPMLLILHLCNPYRGA